MIAALYAGYVKNRLTWGGRLHEIAPGSADRQRHGGTVVAERLVASGGQLSEGFFFAMA
jgi:hypothetical protein